MVRQKSYTETEQVAILNAILVNKDLLEDPNANQFSRNDAWREKWDEIATTIDTYFGTSRGTKKTRDLYKTWKASAKRKYQSTKITALTAQDFENRLTMPEKILRQIRPDIFPKINSEPTMSTEQGQDEASYTKKKEKLQPPGYSKNGAEDLSNDSKVPERKVLEDCEAPADVAKVSYFFETTTETSGDLNPEQLKRANSEVETLVLSLQSMIDLQSAAEPRVAKFENGSQRIIETVGDVTLFEDLEDTEESVEKKSKFDASGGTADSRGEDAGPSVATDRVMILKIKPVDLSRNISIKQNTVVNRKGKSGVRRRGKKDESSDSTIYSVGPIDDKQIYAKSMEIEVNVKISDEGARDENRANWNKGLEALKIIQTDRVAAPNLESADETFPGIRVCEVVGKHKKAPRAKNAKKRKTADSTSVRV